MNRFTTALLLAALCSAAACARAEESLAELLAKLESDDFTRREEAQLKIRALGGRALADLKAADEKARTADARTRLRALIREIETRVETYSIRELLMPEQAEDRPSLGFGEGYGIGMRYSYRDPQYQERQEQKFLEMLKQMVEPRGWENGERTAAVLNGSLIVNATPPTQKKVADFLQALRTRTNGQLEVKALLVRSTAKMEKTRFTDAELETLLKDLAPEKVLLRSRLVAANYTPSVVLEGRQVEYLPETVVAATEGGGLIGGVRAQQCLEGYALTVLPRWNRELDRIEMTVTFYRNTNLSLRALSEREKWILSRNEAVGKDEKGPVKAERAGAAPDEEKKPWTLPSADLQMLHTDVEVPKGQWLIAGQLEGTEPPEKARAAGLMYLLVRASPLE